MNFWCVFPGPLCKYEHYEYMYILSPFVPKSQHTALAVLHLIFFTN